eukprot:5942489-Pyramimonas_sp.AAC.1
MLTHVRQLFCFWGFDLVIAAFHGLSSTISVDITIEALKSEHCRHRGSSSAILTFQPRPSPSQRSSR